MADNRGYIQQAVKDKAYDERCYAIMLSLKNDVDELKTQIRALINKTERTENA